MWRHDIRDDSQGTFLWSIGLRKSYILSPYKYETWTYRFVPTDLRFSIYLCMQALHGFLDRFSFFCVRVSFSCQGRRYISYHQLTIPFVSENTSHSLSSLHGGYSQFNVLPFMPNCHPYCFGRIETGPIVNDVLNLLTFIDLHWPFMLLLLRGILASHEYNNINILANTPHS